MCSHGHLSEGEAGLQEDPVDDRVRGSARGVALFGLERREGADVVADAYGRAGKVSHGRRGLARGSEQRVARVNVRPLKPVIRFPLVRFPWQAVGNLYISRIVVELLLGECVAMTNVRKVREKFRSFLSPQAAR